MSWPISDGRVSLRLARRDDAGSLFDYQHMPQSQQYVSRTVTSLVDAQRLLEERMTDESSLLYVIEHDGQVVGDIGGRFSRPESLTVEPEAWDFYLGYSIHPHLWGRGLASSAVALLVPLLHDQLGVRRIVAKTFADNVASLRVLTKQGFRLEGTETAAVLGRDGKWLDDCTLAHLR